MKFILTFSYSCFRGLNQIYPNFVLSQIIVLYPFSAEFIIDLADKNPNFDAFKKALVENGAEFSDSFMTNLLRIIQHMKPASSSNEKDDKGTLNSNPLAVKFPGLAIPNEQPHAFVSDESSDEEEKKTKRVTSKDLFKNECKSKDPSSNIVQQAMAELEALAPSNIGLKKDEKEKKEIQKHQDDNNVKGDRSRDRHRKRSRSREKKSRTPDRRHRSKDRDKERRRRSRSHHQHRSRSRDRHRRSRSRGRRSKSRGRRSRSHSRGRDREGKDRYKDFEKRPRKRSPEVEMSEDPEPGKVSANLYFPYLL